MRAALPVMLEQGSGSIVNIASRLGQMGIPETAAYSAAKAGLIGLTRSLAREFGTKGVRINAVAPGVTLTEMTTDLVESDAGKARLRDMALGRFGRADEVAEAVDLPAQRPGVAVHRPDPQPERRRVHAMTESRPRANGKVISVRDAVGLVRDGATVVIGGSGAGHALPQRFIDELATVYEAEGRPRDLTTVRVVGIGDFADRGFSQLGLPGLMRRTIGSNIGNEPRLGALVEANELESYSFPQGVLSELMREIAAGRPGLVTHVGLGTYVDPRQTGGKQNSRTTDDLVEVVTLRGKEWLLFHAFPIDVAVIRGTTADEDGNLTMEGEAVQGEMLAMAMAARNSGGIVIAQVRQLARRGSLPLRDVKVPGALVDHVYVDPDQWQTYITQDSPYYSGRLRKPVTDEPPLPLDVRKIIARRSLLEFPRGAICNLGFGISQLIGRVAWEEGVTDQLVLTVEQGIFGGVPVAGNEGGAGFNYQAMIDQPYMFDFYDGGGLDIASLSFAEVDAEGNVNVHAFEGRVRGPGGFPNISARTPRINFVGTLTAQGLELDISRDGVRVVHEGSLPKFVPEVRQISFSGRLARERGQQVRYVTDRAVFALEDDGLVLIEVAPGIDVERDVLGQMGFRPRVADDLREMDRRIYASGPMGLAEDFAAAGPARLDRPAPRRPPDEPRPSRAGHHRPPDAR